MSIGEGITTRKKHELIITTKKKQQENYLRVDRRDGLPDDVDG